MPQVTLLTHTPAPERTIAAAARLCYSPASIADLLDNLSDEKASGFVGMLAEIGHESPIEHVSFTFGIEGVSRSLRADHPAPDRILQRPEPAVCAGRRVCVCHPAPDRAEPGSAGTV